MLRWGGLECFFETTTLRFRPFMLELTARLICNREIDGHPPSDICIGARRRDGAASRALSICASFSAPATSLLPQPREPHEKRQQNRSAAVDRMNGTNAAVFFILLLVRRK
jgi:hypothetical protein